MKMLSFTALASAWVLTSSLAVAGPGNGPRFSEGPGCLHGRGGPASIVFRLPAPPLLRILPHAVAPQPALRFAPRRDMHAHHHAQGPVMRPAPVQAAPQAPAYAASSGRPQRPDGQGNGGNKPQRPAR